MAKGNTTSFDSSALFPTKDFEVRYGNQYVSRKRTRMKESAEFFFFLDGKMTLLLNQKKIPLKRSDMVYLPPRTSGSHLLMEEGTPNSLFFLRISASYIRQLKELSPDYGYLFDFTHTSEPQLYRNEDILFNTILSKLLLLTDEIQTDRYGRETKIYLALDDLILHLNRLAYEHAEKPKHQNQKERNTLYRNLIQYIERHLDEDLTLDHLAEVFFVSKYHISHLFKENLGISIHQYITKKRLSLCRDALLNGSNISKTCHIYGFKDYSSFYRAFTKEYGLSPKKYRERNIYQIFEEY